MSIHILRPVQDNAGNLQVGVQVSVYQPNTSTPIVETIYANADLTSPLENPYTSTDGYVNFYVERPMLVRLGLKNATDPEQFFENVAIGPVDLPPIAWQSYTPVLSASVSDPDLGSGTATGMYVQNGYTVTFQAVLDFENPFVDGSGTYFISLPVEADPSEQAMGSVIGPARLTSGTSAVTGVCGFSSSLGDVTKVAVYAPVPVTDAAPLTWAAGAKIRISGTYRAATPA